MTRIMWRCLVTIGRSAAIGIAGPIAWAVHFYQERKFK